MLPHATLPGAEFNFDFGDIYAGPITRSRKGDDYERERINGHFRTNYNILYHLANVYNNPEAQGVADWLKSKGQVNAEEFWTFIWFNPAMKSTPIERQQRWHYFPDHDVVYWRSAWGDDATAFAFKAGPPEGHATAGKLKLFPTGAYRAVMPTRTPGALSYGPAVSISPAIPVTPVCQ